MKLINAITEYIYLIEMKSFFSRMLKFDITNRLSIIKVRIWIRIPTQFFIVLVVTPGARVNIWLYLEVPISFKRLRP
jgi:hypothetical protein